MDKPIKQFYTHIIPVRVIKLLSKISNGTKIYFDIYEENTSCPIWKK